MALSRFRLRLTAGFAVAFCVGTAILEGAGYAYVTWTGSRYDFNVRLKEAAAGARSAVRQTADGFVIDTTVFAGVRQALRDLSPSKIAFLIYNPTGHRLIVGGDSIMVDAIPTIPELPDIDDIATRSLSNGLDMRFAADTTHGTHVVVAATTDLLRRRQSKYRVRLAVLFPIVLLLALAIGYSLTRFALAPIDALGRAADAIAPGELAGRLPLHAHPDELDELALRFNRLLDRIQALQEQSHGFLREVAHQIRTPLTLVLGEAELGLERERTPEEYVRVLRRVHAAAGQMTHRVQDLMLLARMEAGERPPLRDDVELDALALDATDMFRARAQTLGQHLELQEIVACEVTGDEALLREALLELLENACRHGEPGRPVSVSVRREGNGVFLGVRNAGEPIPTEPRPPYRVDDNGRTGGLGLSIMRWIASVHGGEFVVQRSGRENYVALRLPVSQLKSASAAT